MGDMFPIYNRWKVKVTVNKYLKKTEIYVTLIREKNKQRIFQGKVMLLDRGFSTLTKVCGMWL